MSEIRIAHLADSHLNDANLAGNTRAHDSALEGIARFMPDLIVHAGDIHDRLGSPATPAVRNEAARILGTLAELAPVVLVRGNHDLRGDLQLYGRIRATFPIYVREAADSFRVQLGPDKGVALVQALPWFDKGQLAAGLKADEGDASTTDELTKSVAREMLVAMGVEGDAARARGEIVVGVGHVQIGGSVVSSGQTLIGRGVEMAPADLAKTGAHLWALGHIHAKQTWAHETGSVWYAGSVERLNFGEPEEKVWLAHTLEVMDGAGGDAVISLTTDEIATTATAIVRSEVTLEEANQLQVGDLGAIVGPIDGAQVRVRYRGTPEELELISAPAIETHLREAGAELAQVEPIVERQAAVRSEAMSDQLGSAEQLFEWAKATGRVLDDEAIARIQDKIGQLEGGPS